MKQQEQNDYTHCAMDLYPEASENGGSKLILFQLFDHPENEVAKIHPRYARLPEGRASTQSPAPTRESDCMSE
jgi:hypothetical protein